MTTIVANTFNFIGFISIASWFKKVIAERQRQKNIRATIQQLSALSNHELKDIGIARGDIRYIANTSYPKGKTVVEVNRNLKGWV
jgi:uncharacterized protein YjiS (DUF1127 family)